MALKHVHLFDLEFTVADSVDELIEEVASFKIANLIVTSGHKKPFLITPNVDDIINWEKPEFAQLRAEFSQSIFIVPDGQPLVWFSKLIGRSLIRRVTGSDLFPRLFRILKTQQRKMFFILANEKLCEFYNREGDFVKTYAPPYFQPTDRETIGKIVSECRNIVELHRPEFVFVGIQFPKQNILALELLRSASVPNTPLFLMLGSSMEYYAGTVKRSPRVVQKIGMEWFYRFCLEPRRLFKRYFVNDLPIFGIFFREFWRLKIQSKAK